MIYYEKDRNVYTVRIKFKCGLAVRRSIPAEDMLLIGLRWAKKNNQKIPTRKQALKIMEEYFEYTISQN